MASAVKQSENEGAVGAQSLQQRFPRPQVPTEGLVLFYNPHNFFSQKIFIALLEKRIPFTGQLIDINRGEQFSPWFLELNPRGEVPVLQNGVQIVPESARILSYLEDHFAGDNIDSLFPRELKLPILTRITHFNRLICRLPIGAISMGVFLHPELSTGTKPPLDLVNRESIAKANRTVRLVLAELDAENHPDADALVRRADLQDQKMAAIENRSEFEQLLANVYMVLDAIEAHLVAEPATWLCCDRFTVADLSLAMLLHRLSVLGLDEHGWTETRPLLAEYYSKALARESFRRSLEEQANVVTAAAAELAAGSAAATDTDATEASETGIVSKISKTFEWTFASRLSTVSPGKVAVAVTFLSAAIMLLIPLYTSACK